MHMDKRTVCLAPQAGPGGGCPGHRSFGDREQQRPFASLEQGAHKG
jgi:hypothetical protein